MIYRLRFLFYDRYPQPHYKPFLVDELVDEKPAFERGRAYRLRLLASTDDVDTWPSLVVTKVKIQLQEQATLVEVYMVLEEEHEQFVEPFQDWELN